MHWSGLRLRSLASPRQCVAKTRPLPVRVSGCTALLSLAHHCQVHWEICGGGGVDDLRETRLQDLLREKA